MRGDLLKQARKDVKEIVLSGDFTEDVMLTTPDKTLTIETGALNTKHHVNFDTDGLPVNSMNAHICLVESDLIEKNYLVRNNRNEVNLRNHIVEVKDANGTLKNYVITETLPNDSTGFIVCILGKYEEI